MERTSVTLPSWMVAEIEDRRSKGVRRSEWVRQAIMARFNAEDAGQWTTPKVEQPNTTEPADA